MNNESFNHRDYRKFSTPGEYKEAMDKNHVRIPLQFFIAVSNIMKKRNMAFAEACELLEKERYLIWVGKVAIYNLQGDTLWRD
jgi:hypothetical protein